MKPFFFIFCEVVKPDPKRRCRIKAPDNVFGRRALKGIIP